MPVDLVRVCNTVLMYFAKHRGCTADSLLRHVRSSLSHYRPSCLKAGGLGVIDLPTAPQGRETELPFTKLNEEVELSENVQREEEGIAGENLQRGGGEEGIELREGGQRNGGEGGIGLNERVQRIGEGREERRDWEGEEEGAFVPELGGLKGVRALMEKTVEWPFKYAREFERLAIPKPKGILLYGPPGCAKTSLVRSLAAHSVPSPSRVRCAARILLYGPPGCAKTSLVRTLAAHSVYRVLAASAAQLYSPYVGEAEQNVTQLFHRARLAAPAILFIDEIEFMVHGVFANANNKYKN
ncbi:vacuolar protein sorting-associated protein 4-like [Diaphorina citri]|uniref:Vacuolar protein sorting-associated protein 4-like n=1 Tax=Diaphorina citri TaxID=121845 RepID=A0A3Q0JI01_DIACI|nr:vacuolar protein sorting-associated protein 4-like [Diaphorina citri]